jgi:hypothetical protein
LALQVLADGEHVLGWAIELAATVALAERAEGQALERPTPSGSTSSRIR